MMRINFLEFISYKISNPPKGLLKGDLFLLLIFIVPTFFYAAGTSEKGYFALHKSISANSANTTPITGFEHIYVSEDKTIYITTDVVIDKEVSAAPNSHNKIFPTKKKRITKKKHRPKTIPRQQDLTYFNPNLEKQYLQHCATFATAGIIYKFPVYGGAVSLNKQLLYLSSLPNNNFAIRCTFVLIRLLRALVCRPPPIL